LSRRSSDPGRKRTKLKLPKRPRGAISEPPKSISTLVTEEVLQEALLMFQTFRLYNTDIPIIVTASEGAAEIIRGCSIPHVSIATTVTDVYLDELKDSPDIGAINDKYENRYRAEILYFKMVAIERGIQLEGDSAFVDADSIFFGPLTVPRGDTTQLVVSPRYSKGWQTGTPFGHFNGGLLWSNDHKFPIRWREEYLKNYGFFEEGCLDILFGEFSSFLFPETFNYGAWRERPPAADQVSFHCHLDPARISKIDNLPRRTAVLHLACHILERLQTLGLYVDIDARLPLVTDLKRSLLPEHRKELEVIGG